ncbi:MAG: efflux RND transporter permease subunit [Gammaproteobacteria bacterium]|jgi:hypothetical protein|nr:efflux RND transporter permease subunit [Gammaproteobacteria bacterium]
MTSFIQPVVAFLNQLIQTWGDMVITYPRRALALVLLGSLMAASQLWFIQFDASVEGYLEKDDPAITELVAARQEFGHGEMILVTMQADDLFAAQQLQALQQLHQQLEQEVPWLDSVTSLINARVLAAEADTLLINKLLQPFPQTQAERDAMRSEALSNPLYRNLLISADGRFTTLAIKPLAYIANIDTSTMDSLDELDLEDDFDIASSDYEEADTLLAGTRVTEAQLNLITTKVKSIVAQYQGPGRRLYVGGMPVITKTVTDTMIGEMLTFMPMAIITIAVLMVVLFRRRHGVILPMLTVGLTMLTTAGIICALRIPVQTTMTILPSFLLTVSVGASVHLLSLFFRAYDAGTDKIQALQEALAHTRTPIIFTSLTTAIGLLSFAGSPMIALARLGLFSALGIGVALVYTLTLIPAIICLHKVPRKQQTLPNPKVTAIVNTAVKISSRYPIRVVGISLLVTVAAISSLQHLNFSHDPMRWMSPAAEINQAVAAIDNNMGGSISVDIIVDTSTEEGLYQPVFLQQLEQFSAWLNAYQAGVIKVAKVTGLNDIIKEAHQVLNADDPDFYRIPETAAVVANELFLIQSSGPGELDPLVDSAFQKTRLTIIMPWLDTLYYLPFIADLEQQAAAIFGEQAQITMTGMVPVMGTTLGHVISTTAQSYIIAFGLISIMLMLLLRSWRYGLLAMVPNLSPILVTMGLMYALQIPLDMFTILVASIAIGIAVDDTVHFMYHCQHHYQRKGDMPSAIHHALDTSGRAMLTTSVILSMGFAMLMWSDLISLFNFGMLIGMTVVLALVADFLLAPALMMLFGQRQKTEQQQA